MSYRHPDLATLAAAKDSALARSRELEAEMKVLRKRARRRALLGAIPAGGVGALLGNLAGAVAWAFLGVPMFMLAGAVFGFLAGAVGQIIWTTEPDDTSTQSTSRS